MTTTESKNVRFAVTTSVTVHVILLLIMAWFMGLSTSARLMLKQQLVAKEEPKVTMIFPEQLIPSAKLRPKLDFSKQFIRTSNDNTSTEKPTKSDFISDRNSKASSNAAPFPDGNVAMPSSRGDTRAAPELTNREFRDGKKPGDPLHPTVTPLQPQEPTTIPQLKPQPKTPEVAKADASAVAKMIQEMDKDSDRMDVTKLPIQVKKAEAPLSSSSPATVPPTPSAPKDTPDDFSPLTRKSGVKGTLSSKGSNAGSSVDAEDAPLGRFRNAVLSAVEKKWNEYRLKHAGAVTSGFLRLHFYVNRSGHVEEPEFIEKTSDSLVQDFTLEAILAAELPPIPKDLLPLLEDDRIPFEYSIIIND